MQPRKNTETQPRKNTETQVAASSAKKNWGTSNAGGSLRCDYNRERGAFSCNTPLAVGVKYTLEVSNNVCRASNGAGVDHALDATLTQGGGPFTLFAVYADKDQAKEEKGFSCFGSHRLYSFKVWRNGAILHDCVPYRQNGDADVGLYDRTATRTSASTTERRRGRRPLRPRDGREPRQVSVQELHRRAGLRDEPRCGGCNGTAFGETAGVNGRHYFT